MKLLNKFGMLCVCLAMPVVASAVNAIGGVYDSTAGGYLASNPANWNSSLIIAGDPVAATHSLPGVVALDGATENKILIFDNTFQYEKSATPSVSNITFTGFQVQKGATVEFRAGTTVAIQNIITNANINNAVLRNAATFADNPSLNYYGGTQYYYNGTILLRKGSNIIRTGTTAAVQANLIGGVSSGNFLVRQELIIEGGANFEAANQRLTLNHGGALIFKQVDDVLTGYVTPGSNGKSTLNGTFKVDLTGFTKSIDEFKIFDNTTSSGTNGFDEASLFFDWIMNDPNTVKTETGIGLYRYTFEYMGDFTKTLSDVVVNANLTLNSHDIFSVVGTNGGAWKISYDQSTKDLYFAATVVPEPAEVAALIGIITLGFVTYRRRK